MQILIKNSIGGNTVFIWRTQIWIDCSNNNCKYVIWWRFIHDFWIFVYVLVLQQTLLLYFYDNQVVLFNPHTAFVYDIIFLTNFCNSYQLLMQDTTQLTEKYINIIDLDIPDRIDWLRCVQINLNFCWRQWLELSINPNFHRTNAMNQWNKLLGILSNFRWMIFLSSKCMIRDHSSIEIKVNKLWVWD